MKEVKINFYNGYANSGVKAEAEVDGTRYVLNFDNIESVLSRMIEIYGYRVEKTKAQKIPRLFINSL